MSSVPPSSQDPYIASESDDSVRLSEASWLTCGAKWCLLILPPVVMLTSMGFGVLIDSLTLGLWGFLVALLFLSPVAIGSGAAATYIVASMGFAGTRPLFFLIWTVELTTLFWLYIFVHSFIGGWS